MANLLTHDQVALLLILAIAIGWKANDMVKEIISYRNKARQKKQYAALEKAEDQLCKGPHDWNSITLCLPPLAVGKYKCCSQCGFVSGTKHKLNLPALEVFHAELTRRTIREMKQTDYNKRLQDGEDKIMNENVKKMVSDDRIFDQDLNARIVFFQHYHRMHKLELRSFWMKLEEEFKDLKGG